MAKSSPEKEMQMQLALARCREVSNPNFSDIARDFELVDRQTLSRRFYGTQGSRALATSTYHKNLSNEEEEALIKQINHLTNRGVPPTSQMVKNLAEEMILWPIGKN
jgi:hypothetical protein